MAPEREDLSSHDTNKSNDMDVMTVFLPIRNGITGTPNVTSSNSTESMDDWLQSFDPKSHSIDGTEITDIKQQILSCLKEQLIYTKYEQSSSI